MFFRFARRAKGLRYKRAFYVGIGVIEKFGEINDLRAVPLLISAFASKYDNVRSAASHVLYYDFPGADGVTKAFIDYRNNEGINYYASLYLKKRYNNIKIDISLKNKPHPWYIAKQLVKNNELEKAKEIYKKLIADTTQKASDRIFSTQSFLKKLQIKTINSLSSIICF